MLKDVNIKSVKRHLAVAAGNKLSSVRITADIDIKNWQQASNLNRTIKSLSFTFPVFMADQIILNTGGAHLFSFDIGPLSQCVQLYQLHIKMFTKYPNQPLPG